MEKNFLNVIHKDEQLSDASLNILKGGKGEDEGCVCNRGSSNIICPYNG